MSSQHDPSSPEQDLSSDKWRASLERHLDICTKADRLLADYRRNLLLVLLCSLGLVPFFFVRFDVLVVEVYLATMVACGGAYFVWKLYRSIRDMGSQSHTVNESQKRLLVDFLPQLPKSEYVRFLVWLERRTQRRVAPRMEIATILATVLFLVYLLLMMSLLDFAHFD